MKIFNGSLQDLPKLSDITQSSCHMFGITSVNAKVTNGFVLSTILIAGIFQKTYQVIASPQKITAKIPCLSLTLGVLLQQLDVQL